MITRCENVQHKFYARYGGRGVVVCDRWHTFELFLIDMGERPPGRSIDRFPDRDGNYEPGNCRWATQAQQIQNSTSAKLTMDLVQEIHGRFEHGESRKSIAARMGMSRSHVTGIIAGIFWKGSKDGYPDPLP